MPRVVAGLDGFPQGVGGVADHVHLLFGLKATHCLADFMRELKKASSVWVRSSTIFQTFMSGPPKHGQPSPYFGEYPPAQN